MRRTSFRLAMVLFLSAASLPLAAQTPRGLAPAKAAAVDAAVEAEMAEQQVVGVAVGIIRDGEIRYLKGYGKADREQGTPVTAQTVFNWASNSKPLAAVAAMQLVEQKLLDLDADVRTYVPEFPDKQEIITARRLLCHQSGIPHYSNGQVIATNRQHKGELPFMDPLIALNKFMESPLLFKPGEKTSYSTYAYILLSAVIQSAGKAPFTTQVQERIASPLGMNSLQFDVEAPQPNWATGYVKRQEQIVPAPPEAHYWKHGGGGYKSNIGDFARWAQALLNHKLLSADAEQQIWTPQNLSSGEATTWGLGFTVEDDGGLKVSHGGKQPEATSRMVIYPQRRHGVVVMCNCDFANIAKFSTAIYAALNQE
jgi:CubicO group peptidase (beta-lactamase class C family)